MLATVASLTSANRLKRLLNEYNIQSSVIQTPQSIAKEGCGYSLKFNEKFKSTVSSSADELGIKIKTFFNERIEKGIRYYDRV